jgi:hypothetical protein
MQWEIGVCNIGFVINMEEFSPKWGMVCGDFFWLNAYFLSHVCSAMFSFLKGSSKAQLENDFSDTLPLELMQPTQHAIVSRTRPAAAATGLPVPEVTEGNQEADWAAWQDSVSFQESQFPADAALVEPPKPAKLLVPNEVPDAFASVGRNAP